MEKFSSMMDAASLDASEIILLGDFNIDLLKPQTSWLDITSSYNLVQLVNSPTRITASSKTIIDHIYTTHEQNIRELCVPIFGCSDHLPGLRIFVPTSLCAHVSICPKKWYFVPTSLCAHVPLCPKKWYFVPTFLCAHVSLCPKQWYFVPTSLCAHVSLCPRLYMPKLMPVGVSGRHPLCQ